MAEPWVFVDPIAEHLGGTRDSTHHCIDRKGLLVPGVGRFWKFRVFESMFACVWRG